MHSKSCVFLIVNRVAFSIFTCVVFGTENILLIQIKYTAIKMNEKELGGMCIIFLLQLGMNGKMKSQRKLNDLSYNGQSHNWMLAKNEIFA